MKAGYGNWGSFFVTKLIRECLLSQEIEFKGKVRFPWPLFEGPPSDLAGFFWGSLWKFLCHPNKIIEMTMKNMYHECLVGVMPQLCVNTSSFCISFHIFFSGHLQKSGVIRTLSCQGKWREGFSSCAGPILPAREKLIRLEIVSLSKSTYSTLSEARLPVILHELEVEDSAVSYTLLSSS